MYKTNVECYISTTETSVLILDFIIIIFRTDRIDMCNYISINYSWNTVSATWFIPGSSFILSMDPIFIVIGSIPKVLFANTIDSICS